MGVEILSTAGWDREKWQDWRKKVKTIGGSDAAVVLGMNPFKSPYALWAEKIGAVEPDDLSDKEAVRLGNDLEDYVAKRWSDKTGKKVRRDRVILTNSEYPFAHASPDRAVVGEVDAGLECKTTSSFNTIKKLRDGEIPDTWYCQCQHYMMVKGAKRWYLAAVAFGAGFYDFVIERDEDDIRELARREKEFYDRVTANVPPALDGTQSTQAAMSAVMKASRGITIDASEVLPHLRTYEFYKRQMEVAEEQLRNAEAHIKAHMGEADKAVCCAFSVSWKMQERSTFDRKKYEADHGPIPAQYFKKSTSRPFKVTIKER